MTRDERDIAKANELLQELEDSGLFEQSPAATVFLRKYGNELGEKNPTRFSYNKWQTKEAKKIAAGYARDFLGSSTATPQGIRTVNEHRREGIARRFNKDDDTIDVDRYLEIADRVGDIVANYSLGSDVFYLISDYVYKEQSEIDDDFIDYYFDDNLSEKIEADNEEIQIAIDLFKEQVEEYNETHIEPMSREDMNDLLFEAFSLLF